MTGPERSTRHTWWRLAALVLAAVLAIPAVAAGGGAAPHAQTPSLAVIVVVDGLSWARFEQYRVDGPRIAVGFVQRLNRLLDETLGLDPASRPVAAVEGWALYYTRPLVLRTVAGPNGPAGRPVGPRDVDAALPKVLSTLFAEEFAGVDLASQANSWPASDPTTEFVRNDFDPARSGDATLIPKPGVLMHWDPGRGTGHGSPYEPDTHVPLVFLGGPFAPGRIAADTTPYDLAPTLAALLAVKMPAATSRALVPPPPPEMPAQSRPK